MLGGKKAINCTRLKTAWENDILNRFPAISQRISAINIDKNHISGDIRSSGLFMQADSNVCAKEALPFGLEAKKTVRTEISDATKKYIDTQMDSLMKSGLSEAEAHKKVQDSLESYFGYDAKNGQYVVSARSPAEVIANKDSLLEQTSIPMWNIGWLTKIIKQPFATSHAKNLVSVESFNNPWADVIGLFKESFEGYGKLSNTARGNFKQNNSNPVTNEASQIVDEVFNISVD